MGKCDHDTLLVDLIDECCITDDQTFLTLEAGHKLLLKVRDAARMGFEYLGIEEDSDIKGIIHLKLKQQSKAKRDDQKKL